jgi:hypothetical protein
VCISTDSPVMSAHRITNLGHRYRTQFGHRRNHQVEDELALLTTEQVA